MIKSLFRNKQALLRLIGSAAALILLVVLIEEEGDGRIFSAIRRVSLLYFLAGLLALLCSRLFAALRWYVLLRSADIRVSFLQAAQLTFAGNFSSNFLPTTIGGDLARLAGAMQFGYDRATCLASLVVDRAIGMLGMAFALPLSLSVFSVTGYEILHSAGFAVYFRKGLDFISSIFESFSIWLKKPLALLLSLLSTFGNMAFIYLMLYLLLYGMGHRVDYWMVAGLYTLTYFVTLVPVSINGLGVQELSMTYLLVQAGGLSASEGATIALLTRVLFVVTSLPGALFLNTLAGGTDQSMPAGNTPD